MAISLRTNLLDRLVLMKSPTKLGNEATRIGINLANQNRRAEALGYFNHALDYFEEIDNETERREELLALANILVTTGFPELSIMTIQGAIDVDKRAGNDENLANDLLIYGIAQSNLGNIDEALSIYNQAHDIALPIGDYADAASALTNRLSKDRLVDLLI
jgi:tetratricopeptide (TPR) repeat protein